MSWAYLRAQDAHPGTPPSTREIFAALAHDPSPGQSAAPAPAATSDGADPTAIAGLLGRAELLAVLREPIAWVFTLAERSARGDGTDLAAVARVRAAALHRIDALIAGTATAEPPRIRMGDLLTVAGLLAGMLDPAVVRAAVQAFGGDLAAVLGALWPVTPLAGDAADPRGSCAGPGAASCANYACAAHVYFLSDVVPVANPYAFGGPHLPRTPAPGYWPLVRFPV